MAGASNATRRVRVINANVTLDQNTGFELMIVTEDDARHTVPMSAEAVSALAGLLRPDVVLLFDPEGPTLIVANIVGEWLPSDWTFDKQQPG